MPCACFSNNDQLTEHVSSYSRDLTEIICSGSVCPRMLQQSINTWQNVV